MSLYLIPSVTYNAVTINFTVPSKPFGLVSRGVGGFDKSAAGIPAAYEIRREQLLKWTLTFLESEWSSVEAWLRWAQQTAGSFTFKPDKAQPGTSYTVYLEEPAMGQDIAPTRRTDYIGAFDLAMTFRRTTNTAFTNTIL